MTTMWLQPAHVIVRDDGRWWVVDAHMLGDRERTLIGPMLSVEFAAVVADEADALLVHRLRVIGRELIEANRWPDL